MSIDILNNVIFKHTLTKQEAIDHINSLVVTDGWIKTKKHLLDELDNDECIYVKFNNSVYGVYHIGGMSDTK